MLSYQGSAELKARFCGHVARHQAEDRVLQGTYGVEQGAIGWRGCAVGCSLRSLDEIDGKPLRVDYREHRELSNRLGIPLWLARLEDSIFEGLAPELALGWPARFAEALPVGRDLEMVWPRLALWMLGDPYAGVLRLAKTERSKVAIAGVVALYQRWVDGEKPSAEEWRKARAAPYAAYAYAAAAAAAADAYAYAPYADAAYAYAAADAAAAAAYADAAYAYAAAAADAAAAAAYAYAACKVHWSRVADKLVELMRAA